MIKWCTFLLCFMSVHLFSQEQGKIFEATPLSEVLTYIESQYALSFSFKDENLRGEEVSIDLRNKTIDEILQEIFQQTRLAYQYVDEENLIVTLKGLTNDQASFRICGTVRTETGMDLVGANVWLKSTQVGTSTDGTGAYNFEATTSVDDTLVISYVGYARLQVPLRTIQDKPCRDYFLKTDEDALTSTPIIVREYLMRGVDASAGGNTLKIRPKEMRLMPGLVESDVFTTLQMLPGINAPNETASGLFVRGGTPDQNLILWEGIPIYHSGHMFGMISSLNPNVIDHVDVYRSAISSQYGGRASSVIDIHSQSDAPEKWTGNAGLNMTHAHLSTSVPLWKNAGLIFSGRSSITDDLGTPTFQRYAEKVFQESKVDFQDNPDLPPNVPTQDKFSFADTHFKLLWNPGKSKLSFSAFTGENKLDYTADIDRYLFSRDVLNLENNGSRLSWDHEWSNQWSSHLSAYQSEYSSDYSLGLSLLTDIEDVLFKGDRTNKVLDDGMSLSMTWKPKPEHQLKFGYQYTNQDIDISILNNDEEAVMLDESSFLSRVHSVFSEYSFTNEFLTVNAGVRYQNAANLDRIYFAPRLSMHSRINDHLEIKLSSSKQFQLISQLVILELNDIGIGNEIWIGSNNNGIPVIEATQWSGGLLFNKNKWTIDVEGYVKELSGITTLSRGFGDLEGRPFSHGSSRIRGVDVLARRTSKNWKTWMSYTLSQADYEFPEVAEGTFPASHDQRHTFQFVNAFHADDWEFSLGWQFRSGLPYTSNNGIDTFTNSAGMSFLFIDYDKENGARLKPYHRLDASVLYHFSKLKRIRGYVGLSFQNLYGRRNHLDRDFLIEQEDGMDSQVFQIDRTGLRFTPNVVINLRW